MNTCKGKKFKHQVVALKDIPNISIKGMTYETKFMKEKYPYIDFTNEEYFKAIYPNKYNFGDKVRYIGSELYANSPSKMREYRIAKVIPQVKGDLVYIYYKIVSDNEDYTVAEQHLEKIDDMWIISFSQSNRTDMPAIHQLDYFGYQKKIKGTWKEMFVFETKDEAVAVAEMFANVSPLKLLELCKKENIVFD